MSSPCEREEVVVMNGGPRARAGKLRQINN